jgi:tRNA nucleotidyltransferase (CCA-adding enzyme)
LLSLDSGFDTLQTTVNVDPDDLAEARRRRNVFCDELVKEPNVVEVGLRPSGSLARGTHKDPVNDVDLIVEFDSAAHPGWNQPGDSAEAALEHLRSAVTRRLGASGTDDVQPT